MQTFKSVGTFSSMNKNLGVLWHYAMLFHLTDVVIILHWADHLFLIMLLILYIYTYIHV